jgi:hypothetical protein
MSDPLAHHERQEHPKCQIGRNNSATATKGMSSPLSPDFREISVFELAKRT